MQNVPVDQSPGTVNVDPALVTVGLAYLPTLVAVVLLSTNAKSPLGLVTEDCQLNTQPPVP